MLPLALVGDALRPPAVSVPVVAVCVLTWAALVGGFVVREERRPTLGGWLTLVFFGLFIPWPFLDARFFLPIFPLLIGYLLHALNAALPRATPVVAGLMGAVLLALNINTITHPLAAESRPTGETYAWLRENTPPDAPISARGGAVWLYLGREVAVLPPWPGAPEGAARDLLAQQTTWILLRAPGFPDEAPPGWHDALEKRARLFQLTYENPAEGTRVYRVVGNREAFLAAHAHFVRGVRALAASDWPGGKAALDECLALEPDFPPAEFNRAVACLRLGQKEEARRTLERLLARHPDHAKARSLLIQFSGEVP